MNERRIDLLRRLAGNEPNNGDISYSSTMRYLRNNDPDKVLSFMSGFKKSFDASVMENLDDAESVALMETYQKLKLDPKKLR